MSDLTPKQVENLRVAYTVMRSVPAEKVDLNTYRDDNKYEGPFYKSVTDTQLIKGCGTVGCVAGWLSAHPHFKAQRFTMKPGDTSPTLGGLDVDDAGKVLFGSHFLFNGAPSQYSTGIEGKREALERIRGTLYGDGHISDARNAQLQRAEERMKK